MNIVIVPPIIIRESKIYGLVLTDSIGVTHYFNKDGSYDGWSENAPKEEMNVNDNPGEISRLMFWQEKKN